MCECVKEKSKIKQEKGKPQGKLKLMSQTTAGGQTDRQSEQTVGQQ